VGDERDISRSAYQNSQSCFGLVAKTSQFKASCKDTENIPENWTVFPTFLHKINGSICRTDLIGILFVEIGSLVEKIFLGVLSQKTPVVPRA
jgi:hypothetical protein